MKRTRGYYPFLMVFFLAFWASCATQRLIKSLDPDSRQFLSEVRYIITKQERKIFLNLPPSDREAFIQEFWKKRDPDPETEKNEFKEEYYERIEMANTLFRGGGKPGWLQDRGRVYVLLGPPHERYTYPRGRSFYGLPEELWYYGFFPVIFVDDDWDGDYDIIPISARHISAINRAQMDIKPTVGKEALVFDIDLKIRKTEGNQVIFQIILPYKNIWFEEKEGVWQTTLSLVLEVSDSGGEKVWEKKGTYPISLAEEDLDDVLQEDYVIQVPADLDPGDYTVTLDLENQEDRRRVHRSVKFSVRHSKE